MDYNTQREKLIMPEYGRHVQKMLHQVKSIRSKEKRNEQVRSVVNVMGILNPQLRDMNDFKQKLWDHIFVISDFEMDVDTPYPKPSSDSFRSGPNNIYLDGRPIKVNYYGRNVQNLAEGLAQMTDTPEREEMVKAFAYYMRKLYFIWNKDTVSDQTIFDDITLLSHGKLRVPDGFVMDEVQGEAIRQAYVHSKNGQIRGGFNPNYRMKKRKKKAPKFQ